MAERDTNFEEKESQSQESALEVTELDDQDLEEASGGLNQNCFEC